MTVETEAANAQMALAMDGERVSGALAVGSEPLTPGAPPEPCVNCEAEAAPRWLLCFPCAAKLDEAMLIRLTQKYTALGEWLERAQAALYELPEGSTQFVDGWALWSRKQQVRQRLGWLWNTVKTGAA